MFKLLRKAHTRRPLCVHGLSDACAETLTLAHLVLGGARQEDGRHDRPHEGVDGDNEGTDREDVNAKVAAVHKLVRALLENAQDPGASVDALCGTMRLMQYVNATEVSQPSVEQDGDVAPCEYGAEEETGENDGISQEDAKGLCSASEREVEDGVQKVLATEDDPSLSGDVLCKVTKLLDMVSWVNKRSFPQLSDMQMQLWYDIYCDLELDERVRASSAYAGLVRVGGIRAACELVRYQTRKLCEEQVLEAEIREGVRAAGHESDEGESEGDEMSEEGERAAMPEADGAASMDSSSLLPHGLDDDGSDGSSDQDDHAGEGDDDDDDDDDDKPAEAVPTPSRAKGVDGKEGEDEGDKREDASLDPTNAHRDHEQFELAKTLFRSSGTRVDLISDFVHGVCRHDHVLHVIFGDAARRWKKAVIDAKIMANRHSGTISETEYHNQALFVLVKLIFRQVFLLCAGFGKEAVSTKGRQGTTLEFPPRYYERVERGGAALALILRAIVLEVEEVAPGLGLTAASIFLVVRLLGGASINSAALLGSQVIVLNRVAAKLDVEWAPVKLGNMIMSVLSAYLFKLREPRKALREMFLQPGISEQMLMTAVRSIPIIFSSIMCSNELSLSSNEDELWLSTLDIDYLWAVVSGASCPSAADDQMVTYDSAFPAALHDCDGYGLLCRVCYAVELVNVLGVDRVERHVRAAHDRARRLSLIDESPLPSQSVAPTADVGVVATSFTEVMKNSDFFAHPSRVKSSSVPSGRSVGIETVDLFLDSIRRVRRYLKRGKRDNPVALRLGAANEAVQLGKVFGFMRRASCRRVRRTFTLVCEAVVWVQRILLSPPGAKSGSAFLSSLVHGPSAGLFSRDDANALVDVMCMHMPGKTSSARMIGIVIQLCHYIVKSLASSGFFDEGGQACWMKGGADFMKKHWFCGCILVAALQLLNWGGEGNVGMRGPASEQASFLISACVLGTIPPVMRVVLYIASGRGDGAPSAESGMDVAEGDMVAEAVLRRRFFVFCSFLCCLHLCHDRDDIAQQVEEGVTAVKGVFDACENLPHAFWSVSNAMDLALSDGATSAVWRDPPRKSQGAKSKGSSGKWASTVEGEVGDENSLHKIPCALQQLNVGVHLLRVLWNCEAASDVRALPAQRATLSAEPSATESIADPSNDALGSPGSLGLLRRSSSVTRILSGSKGGSGQQTILVPPSSFWSVVSAAERVLHMIKAVATREQKSKV